MSSKIASGEKINANNGGTKNELKQSDAEIKANTSGINMMSFSTSFFVTPRASSWAWKKLIVEAMGPMNLTCVPFIAMGDTIYIHTLKKPAEMTGESLIAG
jgi:hypothetical protein